MRRDIRGYRPVGLKLGDHTIYTADDIKRIIASVAPAELPRGRCRYTRFDLDADRRVTTLEERSKVLKAGLETAASAFLIANSKAAEPLDDTLCSSLRRAANSIARARQALNLTPPDGDSRNRWDLWSIDCVPYSLRYGALLDQVERDRARRRPVLHRLPMPEGKLTDGTAVRLGHLPMPTGELMAETLRAVGRLERWLHDAAEVYAASPALPATRPKDHALNEWTKALAETFKLVFKLEPTPGSGQSPGPFVRFVAACSTFMGDRAMKWSAARSRISRALDGIK